MGIRKMTSAVATVALATALFKRPSVIDGTGILLLNGQWQGVPRWCSEILQEAIEEIEHLLFKRVQHVSINIILPDGRSGWHKDPTPQDDAGHPIIHDRWHLPLQTNPGAWFEDRERIHMEQGYWHGPVEYWLPHAVGNDGSEPRMHLVCDLL